VVQVELRHLLPEDLTGVLVVLEMLPGEDPACRGLSGRSREALEAW
jgi:hypothetical protein